jgi:HEAT repeat protein
MTEPREQVGPDPASSAARGRKRAILAVAIMVFLWLLVVIYRQEIRVRWWGYRLRNTADLNQRMYYTGLLAGAGELALREAERLLGDDDAAVRSYAIVLANFIAGDEAFQLLERASRDADASVRQSAIVGLAMRPSADAVRLLRALADHPDIETAMLATSQLATSSDPGAAEALCGLAVDDRRVGVRAQAIEALGRLAYSNEVADALIACLADTAVFDGLTMTQRDALESLARAAPHLIGEQAGEVVGAGESNRRRAAHALRSLTGEEFGCLETPGDDWSACVEAWQEWRGLRPRA